MDEAYVELEDGRLACIRQQVGKLGIVVAQQGQAEPAPNFYLYWLTDISQDERT